MATAALQVSGNGRRAATAATVADASAAPKKKPRRGRALDSVLAIIRGCRRDHIFPGRGGPLGRRRGAGKAHRLTKRAWGEVLAALATGVLHPLTVHVFEAKGVFILVAAVGWSFYIGLRVRGDKRAIRVWGLSFHGLRPTARIAAVFAIAATAVMAVVALRRGSLQFHADMIPLVLLYPVWGLIQQVLVQGMVVGNLVSCYPHLSRSTSVVVVAGLLFGAVHLPDPVLTGASALMGGLFAAVFVRHRNVWPLGFVHGALGVLFYFWVLERDPWPELLASVGLV
jgi:CAAX prenyl protease-like protein